VKTVCHSTSNTGADEHRAVSLLSIPDYGCSLSLWTVCAQGDVLEVSAGTGRNLPFYTRKQLTSLTLTDSSKGMLFHTRAKAAAAPPGVPTAVHLSDAARLAARDVATGGSGEAAAQSGAAGELPRRCSTAALLPT
jgi:SAM-dependent methyltransferase